MTATTVTTTLDRQKVLNTAVAQIIKQGGPAVSAGGNCRYRTAEGRMCALGALIPPNTYDPCFEGRGVAAVYRVIGAYEGDIDFLSEMQGGLHDSLTCGTDEGFLAAFPRAVAAFAASQGLKNPLEEGLSS